MNYEDSHKTGMAKLNGNPHCLLVYKVIRTEEITTNFLLLTHTNNKYEDNNKISKRCCLDREHS